MDWGVNDYMAGIDGPKLLVILQKDVSWDFDSGTGSPAGGYGMRSSFVGSVSWDFYSEPPSPAGALSGRYRNSQHSKNCVPISSWRKDKNTRIK